ncbi:MAG: Mth938-like domain-containing protein [Rhodoferax sp.]|nr:Mth938-like domain-containing protein [Rhodoferax sp.]
MKIQPDARHGQSITAYGPGWLEVNRERFHSSLVVSAMGDRLAWNCTEFAALEASHFELLLTLEPELVIFGSGERIRFPEPQWLQALYARRIGIETMDTNAACRSYNFLAAEGRRVVAALLLSGPSSSGQQVRISE